ncbi:hypothetical protein SLEP1_g44813 [Rubroshorea leprosula]|uniref:Uncharacterized protein n=1 Tax=Rubroshorea leprosula TaxID=152421 RepID=A0AAV5LHA2_9ROSI|nr:hypothetical protein SLEP1_g44813 [Rubroshorea leprosula]
MQKQNQKASPSSEQRSSEVHLCAEATRKQKENRAAKSLSTNYLPDLNRRQLHKCLPESQPFTTALPLLLPLTEQICIYIYLLPLPVTVLSFFHDSTNRF